MSDSDVGTIQVYMEQNERAERTGRYCILVDRDDFGDCARITLDRARLMELLETLAEALADA